MTKTDALVDDGHVHITARGEGTGRSARDLIADMDSAGVRRAAVVTPSTLGWDNTLTFDAVAEHPTRFVPIARVDLRAADGLDTLREVVRDGAVGVRITTFGESDLGWLLEERMTESARVLAANSIVAEFHCEPEQLQAVGRFASAHPGVPVLIDHLGRPVAGGNGRVGEQAFLNLAQLPNVFAKSPDLGFFSTVGYPYSDIAPFIATAIDQFGADRIMWSSDWPQTQDEGEYRLSLDGMLAALARRTDHERNAVLSGTFTRLFGAAQSNG
ncbi:MAG: amidohydrolase [Naasia sp.]|jgi:L-fuconolactonase|uniref:amidohydrolase family protein n=1 Tax=Naasia sp. TaxID=2546198 RepID=UPI002622C549|nr:amidohydrolase family protein [Naasia sp.]MCU1571915.1 amidohydrolase [Naasia sp.]